MPPVEPDPDPFFIGWFPMPPAYARLLAPVALVLLAALAVGGAVLAWGQRSPGPGTWADDATTFTGVAFAEPYAHFCIPATEPGGAPRTIFLVEEGKFGAKERVRPFDGRPVRVRGTLLSRGDLGMLELMPGDEGLRAAELPGLERDLVRRTPPLVRDPVSLRGEIVDSKCYLGAMKPGNGRTHKGCAVLCLKGGIPPVFVAEDGESYLLTDPDGGPLDMRFFDLAAERLKLDGVREDWNDLRVLKVAFPPK